MEINYTPDFFIEISGALGLSTSNAFESKILAAALLGMDSPQAFLDFVREEREKIEYKTRSERLDILATRYKKIEEKAKALAHVGYFSKFIETIVLKLKSNNVAVTSMNAKRHFKGLEKLKLSELKTKEGFLFREKELDALVSVCPKYVSDKTEFIWKISREGKLEEMLKDALLQKYISTPKHKALKYEPISGDVVALLGGSDVK